MTDVETKVCYTCDHYPNNEHCIGCVWDKEKGNTKWEFGVMYKVVLIEVLDKIRAEIDAHRKTIKDMANTDDWYAGKIRGLECAIEIIGKYREE